MFDTLFETCVEPSLINVFGVAVTFQRVGQAPISLTATWYARKETLRTRDELGEHLVAREWVLEASELSGMTPREGDWIITVENGTSLTFEILPDDDMPSVERLPGGFRWLCRTKRVV